MATTLTPQMTSLRGSLQKIKLIRNPIKQNSFYFIKSETSDSFVNHFYGHFAYLKTLDFYFKRNTTCTKIPPPPPRRKPQNDNDSNKPKQTESTKNKQQKTNNKKQTTTTITTKATYTHTHQKQQQQQ